MNANTYIGVLNCTTDVAAATREAGFVRSGTRLGFQFDRIIEEIQATSATLTEVFPKAAIGLLLTLAIADIVLVIGQTIIGNARMAELSKNLVFRLLTISFLMFVILNIEPIVFMVANAAAGLGEELTANKGVSLSAYARGKSVLIFSFSEGNGSLPFHIRGLIFVIGLIVTLITGLTMGVVVYAYASLFVGAMIGVLAAGFGGLSAARQAPRTYLFSIAGGGLKILTLMIILNLSLTLSQDLRGLSPGLETALVTLCIDVVAALLAWTLPGNIARLAEG